MVPKARLMAPEKTRILTGPTASGKTALAIQEALQDGRTEIINADSLCVYRHLDIGTAKPNLAERAGVPHHLIDIINPDQPFTAAEFRKLALEKISEVQGRGNRALIVGGTGFYLKALLFGVWDAPKSDPKLREELEKRTQGELHQELEAADSKAARRIGPNDRYRLVRALEVLRLSGKTPTELEEEQNKTPDPSMELVIVDRPDAELFARIQKRTRQMIEAGIIEEVQRVRDAWGPVRPLSAVGYREVGMYIDGTPPEGRKVRPGLEGLEDEITLATRQLVKTQRTFFRNLVQSVPGTGWRVLSDDSGA
jgi:tRNA dimethylallyltransferase